MSSSLQLRPTVWYNFQTRSWDMPAHMKTSHMLIWGKPIKAAQWRDGGSLSSQSPPDCDLEIVDLQSHMLFNSLAEIPRLRLSQQEELLGRSAGRRESLTFQKQHADDLLGPASTFCDSSRARTIRFKVRELDSNQPGSSTNSCPSNGGSCDRISMISVSLSLRYLATFRRVHPLVRRGEAAGRTPDLSSRASLRHQGMGLRHQGILVIFSFRRGTTMALQTVT